jgi:hypothetical protein
VNAAGLVERWVGLYTRGLPAITGRERRAELASDLWEHRAALGDGPGMQLAIAWRCLRGVPADLRWRRAHRTGSRLTARRAVRRGVARAIAGGSYLLLVVNHAFGATPFFGLDLDGADWNPDGRRAYSSTCAALLVLLVAGAICIVRRPGLGAAMISLGALASPLAFLGGALVLGPAAITVTTTAIILARRRGVGRPATGVGGCDPTPGV